MSRENHVVSSLTQPNSQREKNAGKAIASQPHNGADTDEKTNNSSNNSNNSKISSNGFNICSFADTGHVEVSLNCNRGTSSNSSVSLSCSSIGSNEDVHAHMGRCNALRTALIGARAKQNGSNKNLMNLKNKPGKSSDEKNNKQPKNVEKNLESESEYIEMFAPSDSDDNGNNVSSNREKNISKDKDQMKDSLKTNSSKTKSKGKKRNWRGNEELNVRLNSSNDLSEHSSFESDIDAKPPPNKRRKKGGSNSSSKKSRNSSKQNVKTRMKDKYMKSKSKSKKKKMKKGRPCKGKFINYRAESPNLKALQYVKDGGPVLTLHHARHTASVRTRQQVSVNKEYIRMIANTQKTTKEKGQEFIVIE